MKHKPWLIGCMISGVLAASFAAGWPQTKPGSADPAAPGAAGAQKPSGPTPGPAQREEGATAQPQKRAGEPAASREAAPKMARTEEMKKAQGALKEKGHDPGPIDGIAGPQTQKALREFQKANNLKVTGRLDAETAKALGVEAGMGARSGPGMEPSGEAAAPKKEPGQSGAPKGPGTSAK